MNRVLVSTALLLALAAPGCVGPLAHRTSDRPLPSTYTELITSGDYFQVNAWLRGGGERIFNENPAGTGDNLKLVELPGNLTDTEARSIISERGLRPGNYTDLVICGALIGLDAVEEPSGNYEIIAPDSSFPMSPQDGLHERGVSTAILRVYEQTNDEEPAQYHRYLQAASTPSERTGKTRIYYLAAIR